MYPGYFTGTLYGNGYTIYVDIRSSYFSVGLFSELLNANVYDLIIDGSIFATNYTPKVGGIAGHSYLSEIRGCINYANITGEAMLTIVGGIVG